MTDDPTDTPEQCTATASSTGERCKRDAIDGTTVCRYHGGAAPQVQEKAQERVDERLNRMAREVLKESEPQLMELIEAFGDAEGIDEQVTALREIRQWTTSLLDRTDHGPTETREVTGDEGGPIMVIEHGDSTDE